MAAGLPRALRWCGLSVCLLPGCIVADRNFDATLADEQQSDQPTDSPQPEDAGGSGKLCQRYCADVTLACTGDDQLFPSETACLSACRLLDEGKSGDETGNTVACRAAQAARAKISEAGFNCQNAAIASTKCGSPCEAYCTMHSQACAIPSQVTFEEKDCERQCAGVPAAVSFSLKGNYADDTIQCRLIHLVSASVSEAEAETHCPHAKLASPQLCGADQDVSCKDYCQTVMTACTGQLAEYATDKECEAACAVFELGARTDTSQNTVGCRQYHAYTALADPEDHCSHAGPSGDGHCGTLDNGNCESYCWLAAAACRDEFDARFDDDSACQVSCKALGGALGNQGYPPATEQDADEHRVQLLTQAAVAVLGSKDGAGCGAVFAQ